MVPSSLGEEGHLDRHDQILEVLWGQDQEDRHKGLHDRIRLSSGGIRLFHGRHTPCGLLSATLIPCCHWNIGSGVLGRKDHGANLEVGQMRKTEGAGFQTRLERHCYSFSRD